MIIRQQSTDIVDLIKAFHAAKAEFGALKKEGFNPQFKSKYAKHEDILEAIRNGLYKHEIDFEQEVIGENNSLFVVSALYHNSGQYRISICQIPDFLIKKAEASNDCGKALQEIGKIITYFKKYTALGLFGLTDSELDTDGYNEPDAKKPGTKTGNPMWTPTTTAPVRSGDTITKDQCDTIVTQLQNYPKIAEQILEGFKIKELAFIPATHYHATLNKIIRLKSLNDEVEKNKGN